MSHRTRDVEPDEHPRSAGLDALEGEVERVLEGIDDRRDRLPFPGTARRVTAAVGFQGSEERHGMHPRRPQPGLAGAAHLAQQNMPRIALNFRLGKGKVHALSYKLRAHRPSNRRYMKFRKGGEIA